MKRLLNFIILMAGVLFLHANVIRLDHQLKNLVDGNFPYFIFIDLFALYIIIKFGIVIPLLKIFKINH